MKMITIDTMEQIIYKVLFRFEGMDNIRRVKEEFDLEIHKLRKSKYYGDYLKVK